MEIIVNKLSEIESIAEKIMESANQQKQEIAKSMEERTIEFDKMMDEDTSNKLLIIKEEYKAATEKELGELRRKTQKIIQTLDHIYDTEHTKLAERVLNKIIEVS